MRTHELLLEIKHRWEGRSDQEFPAHYTQDDRDLARSRERAEIHWALKSISPRKGRVVRMLAGVDHYPVSSVREVAQKLGNVSPGYIRNILTRALDDLCHPLRLGSFLKK